MVPALVKWTQFTFTSDLLSRFYFQQIVMCIKKLSNQTGLHFSVELI